MSGRRDGAAKRAYRGPREIDAARKVEANPGRPTSQTIVDQPPAEEGLERTPNTLRVRMIPADVFLGGEGTEGIVDLPPEERAEAIRNYHSTPDWTEEDERRWRAANPR